MKGSVKLPVFIDEARKLVNTTQLRAKYLGASYEAEYCQWQTLHSLGSLMETASLIITPNAYLEGQLLSTWPPDGSGDMSVTRATTATRVNSAGLVELVPYNLFSYSQNLANGSWSTYAASGTITRTANYGVAPDGTNTATRIQNSGGDPIQWTYQNILLPSNGIISMYVKRTGASNQTFRFFSNNGVTFSSNFTATDTWQRFEFAVGSNTGALPFGITTDSSGTAADILVWGAQLNEGTIKPYQKTETRLNIPRLDYSNGTCPSILVEPQRTNLLTYSSSFNTNLPWQSYGSAVITANNATSPDGTMNADKVSVDGVYNTQLSFTSNTTYSLSIFIKKDTATSFGIGYVDTSGPFTGGSIFYNFATEVISVNQSPNSSVSGTAENYGNGWIRLIMKFTTNASSNYNYIETNYIGGSGWVWGAQLEVGSYPTSYIPTTSASVTRNADVISKTGISSLIGQTEGVIFYDFILSTTGVDFTLGNLYSSSNGNSYSLLYINPSNQIGASLTDNGITQCEIVVPTLSLGRHKIAFAYKANDFAVYVDGQLIGTDTSGSVPNMDSFNMVNFNLAPNAYRQEVNIYASALWKTRLTNAQLAQLTTI